MPRDRAVPKTGELDCDKQGAAPPVREISAENGECMPLRVFVISVLYGESATEEFNKFVAAHRIAHIERRWTVRGQMKGYPVMVIRTWADAVRVLECVPGMSKPWKAHGQCIAVNYHQVSRLIIHALFSSRNLT
jgi:hypothetical protein